MVFDCIFLFSMIYWLLSPGHTLPMLKCFIIMTVDFFKKYYIVAMNSDNITFYAYEIIKVKSGFNFFASWHQHPKKQLKYFSNSNNSTTLMPQGCLENRNPPLSFNLIVWLAKSNRGWKGRLQIFFFKSVNI